MTDFVVQGRLTLDASQFEGATRSAARATEELKKGTAQVPAPALPDIDPAARRYSQSSKVLGEANDNVAASVDRVTRQLTNFQRTQLSFQLNDVFTQLASGQGVVRTAVQQGPQITQIFGGLGNTLRLIPVPALAAAAAIAAVALPIGIVGSRAAAEASQVRQFNVALAAMGRQGEVTADQLGGVVDRMRQAGTAREDARAVVTSLLRNPDVPADQIGRFSRLAPDLAAAMGTGVGDAARQLGELASGGYDAIMKLDRALGGFLSVSQRDNIRLLAEQGRQSEALTIALGALETRVTGLRDRGLSPTEKSVNSLSASWDRLVTAMSKGIVAKVTLQVAQAVVGGAAWVAENIGFTPTKPEDAARDALAIAVDRLEKFNQATKNYRSQDAEVTIPGFGFGAPNSIRAQLEALVEKARSEVERLDRAAGRIEDAAAQRPTAEGLPPVGIPYSTAPAMREEVTRLLSDLDKQQRVATAAPGDRPRLQAEMQAETIIRERNLNTLEAEALKRRMVGAAIAEQAAATARQIEALASEAQASLMVADAYGKSREAGLRAVAVQQAHSAALAGQIMSGEETAFAQIMLEKQAGAAIATQAEKNRAYADEIEGMRRVAAAEKISSEAAREAEAANKAAAVAEALRASAAATNSPVLIEKARQQAEAYADLTRQQLQVDRQRAGNQLNVQFDPQVGLQQRMAGLRTLQQQGVLTERTVAEATRRYQQEALDASRDATDGMQAGLSRYADEASNAGRQVADAMYQSFQRMEDALVQFTTTGKLDFANLVNSMIADLARLAIRQSITGPLSSALGSALGGIGDWLFGSSGSAANGTAVAKGSTPVFEPSIWSTTSKHAGGFVGDAGPSRDLPSWLFAGARRYHTGGIVLGADEVPIIARRGERVLTQEEAAGYGKGGGKTEIHIHTPQGMQARQQSTPTAGGGESIMVMFERVETQIAQGIIDRRGPVSGALQQVYGMQPMGRT
ncbi:MAG: phage tail length tape measure family protein [Proteobacteria bacterium]|nr:phage tail length tape measure family protein [Pseudomonadota bacterium]